jgi:hypothetical protein
VSMWLGSGFRAVEGADLEAVIEVAGVARRRRRREVQRWRRQVLKPTRRRAPVSIVHATVAEVEKQHSTREQRYRLSSRCRDLACLPGGVAQSSRRLFRSSAVPRCSSDTGVIHAGRLPEGASGCSLLPPALSDPLAVLAGIQYAVAAAPAGGVLSGHDHGQHMGHGHGQHMVTTWAINPCTAGPVPTRVTEGLSFARLTFGNVLAPVWLRVVRPAPASACGSRISYK